MILNIRADEACHRDLNHHFADLKHYNEVEHHEVDIVHNEDKSQKLEFTKIAANNDAQQEAEKAADKASEDEKNTKMWTMQIYMSGSVLATHTHAFIHGIEWEDIQDKGWMNIDHII